MDIIVPVIAAAFWLGVSGLKVDREYQRGVVFRLGRYICYKIAIKSILRCKKL